MTYNEYMHTYIRQYSVAKVDYRGAAAPRNVQCTSICASLVSDKKFFVGSDQDLVVGEVEVDGLLLDNRRINTRPDMPIYIDSFQRCILSK